MQQRKRLLMSIIAIIGLGVVWRFVGAARAPRVVVFQPREAKVTQALTVTGRVAGDRESDLAPMVNGVIQRVLVREGQQVRAGDVLAVLDAEVQEAELAQADAAIQTAQAQLTQAQASTRVQQSDVAVARAETQGAVLQAEAQVARAEAKLAEVQAGATPDVRKQARATVEQAQAQLAQAKRELARARVLADEDDTARATLNTALAEQTRAQAAVKESEADQALAKAELERYQRLYESKAVSRSALDRAIASEARSGENVLQARARLQQADTEARRQLMLLTNARDEAVERAQTAMTVAERALEAAQAREREVATPRPEVLIQQRAEVRNARAALQAARRAGPARVQAVMERPDTQQVEVAVRRLEEAVRAREVAQQQLQATLVRAPFNGVVAELLRDPGSAAGPSQPILLLSEMDTPEVLIDIEERDISLLHPNQAVTMTADVYPNQPFTGTLTRIGTRANPQRGTVQIAVRPARRPAWLQTGMTVDVSILLAREVSRIVVPAGAIIRENGQPGVLVVTGGKVVRRAVTLGAGSTGGAIITDGVNAKDLLVRDPYAVKPRQRVKAIREEVAR